MDTKNTLLFIFYLALLVVAVVVFVFIIKGRMTWESFTDYYLNSEGRPEILLHIQDIPEQQIKGPSGVFTDLMLTDPNSQQNTGGNTWNTTKDTTIYFVPDKYVNACNNDLFRRPYFYYTLWQTYNRQNPQYPAKQLPGRRLGWYKNHRAYTNTNIRKRLEQKFKVLNQQFGADVLGKIINSNCKIVIPNWEHVWENQEKLTVTNDEATYNRGPPETWFKVVQPSGSGDSQHPLLKMEGTVQKDGSSYKLASVSTIRPDEIYGKMCANVSPPQRVLPDGTFLVFNGYPVKSVDFVVNNKITAITKENIGKLASMFKQVTKVKGRKEYMYYTPNVGHTFPCYIFMADLCGAPFIFKQVPVFFNFNKRILIKKAYLSDSLSRGNINSITKRIHVYTAALERLRERAAKSEAKYKQMSEQLEQRYKTIYAKISNLSGRNAIMRTQMKRKLQTNYNKRRRNLQRYYIHNIRDVHRLIRLYESRIQRMQAIINSLNDAMLKGVQKILLSAAIALSPTGASPGYDVIEDLYSLEMSDSSGKPIKGTEKIYIKISE